MSKCRRRPHVSLNWYVIGLAAALFLTGSSVSWSSETGLGAVCRGPYYTSNAPSGLTLFYFFSDGASTSDPAPVLQQAQRVAIWPQDVGDDVLARELAASGRFSSVLLDEAAHALAASGLNEKRLYWSDEERLQVYQSICEGTGADVVFAQKYLAYTIGQNFFPSKRRRTYAADLVGYSCTDRTIFARFNIVILVRGPRTVPVGEAEMSAPASKLWAQRIVQAAESGQMATGNFTVSESAPYKSNEKLLENCTEDLGEIKKKLPIQVSQRAEKQVAWGQFTSGSFRFETGNNCVGPICINVGNNSSTAREDQLYRARAWKDLAEYLIYERNLEGYYLRYLYLGYAAEGLGYLEAARSYFQIASQDTAYYISRRGKQGLDRVAEALALREEEQRQAEEAERRAEEARLQAEQRERERKAALAAEAERKAAEKARQAEQRKARQASLSEKYPADWVAMIMRGEVDVGWTEDAVREALGTPVKIQSVGPQDKLLEFPGYSVVFRDGRVTHALRK